MAEIYLGKNRLSRFVPPATIRKRSRKVTTKAFPFTLERALLLPCLAISLGQQRLSGLGRCSG